MKICMVTDFYAPVIGGRERGVAALAEELAERGHDVNVLTQAHPDAPDREVVRGVGVYRLGSTATALRKHYEDPNKPFSPTAPDPRLRHGIRGWLDRERPDVLHTHSWSMYSALSAARAEHAPRRIHTAHEYGLMCPRNTMMTSRGPCPGRGPLHCIACSREVYGAPKAVLMSGGLTLSRRMHRRLDALCVISTAVGAACDDDPSLASVPMYLTPECVPGQLAVSAAADRVSRPDWLPEGPFALFVGALGPHKGLNAILAARRQLDYSMPLVVMGMPRHDTPDLSTEPDLTVRYDAPHDEVMTAWRSATIGLAPSVWAEPLGLVAVEAQLAGCALIASDTGGLRDVVTHELNGLRVPPGDVTALGLAMDRLWRDDALRLRLSTAGRETALAFTAPRVVDQLVEIYQNAPAG